MKKLLLSLSIIASISMTFADYSIKTPLEASQGGPLPNGAIKIGTLVNIIEEWLPITSTYSSWLDNNAPYNCTNWTPAANTYVSGVAFTQTATDCSQEQTRTVQDLEQETNSGSIRNVGAERIEYQTYTTTSTRESTGTLECLYGLYTNKWQFINATSSSLTWYGALNNVTIGSGTTYTYDGYNYSIGTLQSGNTYSICRSPI